MDMRGLFLPILILSSIVVYGQSKEAMKYNNRIVSHQQEITPMVINYLHMLAKHNCQTEHKWYKQQRKRIEKKLDKAVREIRDMQTLQGDTELHEAALAWFQLYLKSFSNEYEEIASVLGRATHSEEDMSKIATLKLKLLSEEERVDQRFLKAQEAFALKYNLSIKQMTFKN